MHISNTGYQKIVVTWWMLRLTYGLLFIVIGIDKFLNIVTFWPHYVSPFALSILPLTAFQLVSILACIEIAIGLLILTKWVKIGAYASAGVILIAAINLLSTGTYFDIAARDVVMAIGAVALAFLTDIKKEVNL